MTTPAITRFRGPHEFLSNFFEAPMRVDVEPGVLTVATVEHGFQSDKSFDPEVRRRILLAPDPGAAKRLGRRCAIRPDWEIVKHQSMLWWLRTKFALPELRALLLGTGNAELVEGNPWGDRYWGVCDGVGENWLGRHLMEVRAEIRSTMK